MAAIKYCQTPTPKVGGGGAGSPAGSPIPDDAAAATVASGSGDAEPPTMSSVMSSAVSSADQEVWAEHIDPSSGQHFFYSRKTRKCTFERPTGPNIVIRAAGSSNTSASDPSQLGTTAFAYLRDPKTTSEHEYHVYERCPVFTPQHRSLLSRLLTCELWDNVQGKKKSA